MPKQCGSCEDWDVLFPFSQDTIANVLGMMIASSEKRPLNASLELTRRTLVAHSLLWSGYHRFAGCSKDWPFPVRSKIGKIKFKLKYRDAIFGVSLEFYILAAAVLAPLPTCPHRRNFNPQRFPFILLGGERHCETGVTGLV